VLKHLQKSKMFDIQDKEIECLNMIVDAAAHWKQIARNLLQARASVKYTPKPIEEQKMEESKEFVKSKEEIKNDG